MKPGIKSSVRLSAISILFVFGLMLNSHAPAASAQIRTDRADGTVRIGVFGLFHPRELIVTAPLGHALLVQVADQSSILDASSGSSRAIVDLSGPNASVVIAGRRLVGPRVSVSGRDSQAVALLLTVPNKITRRYWGTLTITPNADSLAAVLTMDLETAVASVVAAESLVSTPMEALKAQAVATRSYLLAGRNRHPDFDFCDTTHCQYLREPPAVGSPVDGAMGATRGLVLSYNEIPFAAMYTRSCSGRTLTPQQVGLSSSGYPYFSVECRYCLNHPARWTTHLSPHDAAMLRNSNETSRLNLDRRLGWETVPSNDFASKREGDEIVLEGKGYGHGIGLCQAGARAMAAQGASFREILSQYYPNTNIVSLSVSEEFASLQRHHRN